MPAMLLHAVMEKHRAHGALLQRGHGTAAGGMGKAAPARRGKLGTSPVSLEVP